MGKRGFTMVEIVVVLVILAILAATAIPTLIGFIGDARGKALLAAARTGYTAAQAIYTEHRMVNGSTPSATNGGFENNRFTDVEPHNLRDRFAQMIAPDLNDADFRFYFSDVGTIDLLIYHNSGYIVQLIPGQSSPAAVASTGNAFTGAASDVADAVTSSAAMAAIRALQ